MQLYTLTRIKKRSDQELTIKAVGLKTIFKQNNLNYCDFLKVDVEGEEYEFFYNLSEDMFRRIKYISMEYHNLDLGKQNGSELGRFLKSKNFDVEKKEAVRKDVGQIFAANKNPMDQIAREVQK